LTIRLAVWVLVRLAELGRTVLVLVVFVLAVAG
jgi:hypothetical protein